jgi:oxaloacetate decarboxylase alpha subunit
MGYPIIVTPVSQLVATQATRNVIDGERWANVSDETIRYFLGHYGEAAAPLSPEIADKVLSLPRADELRDLEPLHVDRARFRKGISDEELLLRLVMPAEQVDAMRSVGDAAPEVRSVRHPVVRLLREVAKREEVTHLSVAAGDDRIEWRRA